MTMPVDYAVNKSAINHFTRYLAKLFKNKNIRVNTLSPGGISNNQPSTFQTKYKELTVNKGMLESKDICGTLLFLLSDNSTFVNGQNTTQGGTHQAAFREAYVKTIREFFGKSYDAADIRKSIIAAISIKVMEPVFESQTKTKLGSTDMGGGDAHRSFLYQ